MLVVSACAKPAPDQRLVHSVSLRGVSKVDEDKLLDGLETRRTGWWPFAEVHEFDAAALDRDVRRVEAFYATHGFFDARVVQRAVRPRGDEPEVDVTLTIEEGQPALVAAIDIDGLAALPAELRARLQRGAGLTSGQRFDHARFQRTKVRLKQTLLHAGYAYAKVTGKAVVDRSAHRVRLRIRLESGPLVRFGKTRLKGNGPIPGDKLRRLVTWEEGETYDPRQVVLTRARLYNQRLFGAVSIKLPKEPTPVADMRIKLVPAKLRELRLGVGFGFEKQRHEVRLSGRWTVRNFLGGMRTLSVQVKPSYVALPTIWASERDGPAVESEARLTQPDIFATRITAYGSAGYELGLHEGYRFHGPKLQLGVERGFFNEHVRLGLSWNLQFVDFFDIVQEAFQSSSTTLGLGFRDPYRLAWLEQLLQLDLRDQIVDARAGLLAEVRLEQGSPQLAGEFYYIKVVPELRGYIPLGTKRLVLALRAQLGYLRPMDNDESPVTRRLLLGGPTSHRGFTSGRLSPQAVADNGRRIPLGANGSLLGSADLRLRVVQLAGNWLSVAAFCDAGDAVAHFDDLDLGQLHLAVGGSLQYKTPIGAIRLGIGVRLNRLADGEVNGLPRNPDPGQRLAFHLTIGEAF